MAPLMEKKAFPHTQAPFHFSRPLPGVLSHSQASACLSDPDRGSAEARHAHLLRREVLGLHVSAATLK